MNVESKIYSFQILSVVGLIISLFRSVTIEAMFISSKTNKHTFLPPANKVWGKVIFLHLFVILFTGRACMVAGGGHVWLLAGGMHGSWWRGMCGCWWGACMVAGGGHAWLLVGGMHGCWWGACVVAGGGHAWLLVGSVNGCWQGGHAWLLGGMPGCWWGVHGWWGACMAAGGPCLGYDEIQSMSGRYASYWNAFLY